MTLMGHFGKLERGDGRNIDGRKIGKRCTTKNAKIAEIESVLFVFFEFFAEGFESKPQRSGMNSAPIRTTISDSSAYSCPQFSCLHSGTTDGHRDGRNIDGRKIGKRCTTKNAKIAEIENVLFVFFEFFAVRI